MRLRSFTVQSFANFVEPVTLGPLEDVNVLYGPNNVGKSNLLRALELYFRLLGAGEAVTKTQQQMLDESDPALWQLVAASVNRTEPKPLLFTANWSISDRTLEQYGLFPELPCNSITTVLQLTPGGRALELRVQKWQMGDQQVAEMDRAKELTKIGFAQQVRRLLSDACPFQFERPVLPCGRLAQSFEPFPQAVRDALFDARQSRLPAQRRRWAIFARAAGELAAELGEGAWDTVFDRETGHADVVWMQGDSNLNLEDMGAGIQRMAGLLAELALARELYACLEEPEWRLSPELQSRFVRQARQIVRAGIGPRQVFITTHSPILARGGQPFSVELLEGAPLVEQRAWLQAGDSPGDAAVNGTVNGAVNGAGPDLDQLVGLVEELAELDPEEILEEPPAAPSAAPAAASQGRPATAWAGKPRR